MNRSLLVFWCMLSGCGMVLGDTPAKGDNPPENLLVNGGFESGTTGWQTLWARDPSLATTALDSADRHAGSQALRLTHGGQRDWSLAHSLTLKVVPGEIYDLSGWVRVQGTGSVTLGVVTRDAAGKTDAWSYGGRTAHQTKSWLLLRSRFVVPPGIATIQPRLIGDGPATVWCDEFALTRQAGLDALRPPNLPAAVTIGNAALDVTLRTADATFELIDKHSHLTWTQRALDARVIVLSAVAAGRAIDLKLLDPRSMHQFAARAHLDGDSPELVVTIHDDGEMDAPLAWPAPFTSAPGQQLILPLNEGICYPADDASLPAMHYHLYGGHGLCMPWYGALQGEAGWMAIVQTPDDAAVAIPRRAGLLGLVPEWLPQKQRFGPDRVIRYVVFGGGGHVAMAKRYRAYAQTTGLLKSLAEKRQTVPAVDLLVGAVNIWCWDQDAAAWCRELQARGIRRILWSNALPPAQLRTLNDMAVLTSRYDIYQDAMNPENFPRLPRLHPDWTSDAWKNDDLMTDANGEWVRGWEIMTKDGQRIPCGTLCDRQTLPYAKRRIPPELATHPYRSRFLDTTTATPWRECYHPLHPMTRTESKHFKMDLLQYLSDGCGLVCGSETGHDAAVPFVHYFEGMLSLGPYRVPDSGRNTIRPWNEVPAAVAKFQTGHFYRLPLWELVYHDCVVAQWYWGDYNNKLPQLWDRRDLWNTLYGTPPMFMFDRKIWTQNHERFVKSYQAATPVARATGYSPMLSHEWLTADHAVQRTRFANGVVVTVNFGDTPWALPDGARLAPLESHIEGLKP